MPSPPAMSRRWMIALAAIGMLPGCSLFEMTDGPEDLSPLPSQTATATTTRPDRQVQARPPAPGESRDEPSRSGEGIAETTAQPRRQTGSRRGREAATILSSVPAPRDMSAVPRRADSYSIRWSVPDSVQLVEYQLLDDGDEAVDEAVRPRRSVARDGVVLTGLRPGERYTWRARHWIDEHRVSEWTELALETSVAPTTSSVPTTSRVPTTIDSPPEIAPAASGCYLDGLSVINGSRAAAGIVPLTVSASATSFACNHAIDLATRYVVSYSSPGARVAAMPGSSCGMTEFVEARPDRAELTVLWSQTAEALDPSFDSGAVAFVPVTDQNGGTLWFGVFELLDTDC